MKKCSRALRCQLVEREAPYTTRLKIVLDLPTPKARKNTDQTLPPTRQARRTCRRYDAVSSADYEPRRHGELAREDEKSFSSTGIKVAYSNTGMMVLGKVIEAASGQSYFDYVRENITKPAGMLNTDCYELDKVNTNLAVGYEKRYTDSGIEWSNNIFAHVMRGGPQGGGYSTVEDLLKFDQALRSGKLISAVEV